MATATAPIVIPKPSDATAHRILRFVAKVPAQIVLIVLGPALADPDPRPLHHVDPARVTARVGGLVEDLHQAEPRDMVELRRALPQPRPADRVEDHGRDRDRQHGARRHPRRAGGLLACVARVPGPRLDLPRQHRAARGAAADGVDPDVQAVRHLRALRHGVRHHPVSHRVRAAVRDLPAPQLLHRAPEGHPRVGTHRRRVGDPHLRAS